MPYTGGELQATFLSKGLISTRRFYRFPDYDTTWEQIRPQDW